MGIDMLKQLQAIRTSQAMEFRVFTGATAIGLVHAVDDAVINRQPGVPITRHLLALAVVTACALAAIWLFTWVRPGFRSALCLLTGALMAINGALHVIHILLLGPERSDITGAVALVAAMVLISLGLAIPYRHRRQASKNTVRRWLNRLVALVAAAVVAQFFILPVGIGMVQTHKFREAVGEPPTADFSSVEFESSDGLNLTGWYRPSDNGAAVVIVNSAAGDRTGSKRHGELLARHGYGVLMYDARGTGGSEGTPNGWGWDWEYDVEGALDFLQEQPDVDPERLGGLGLSTGADVLIQVAASNRDLRVVISDGATGMSFADPRPPGTIQVPFAWTMFAAGQLFSGTSPGTPLEEQAAKVSPTPLFLIATGSLPVELIANKRYAEAAKEPVELWELPDVTHTNGIDEVADEYERRVIDQLDSALLD
jgi:dienelactone hydrolase